VAQEYGAGGNCYVHCTIIQNTLGTYPSEVTGSGTGSIVPQHDSSGYYVTFSCMGFYTLPNGHTLSITGFLGGGRTAVDIPDINEEIDVGSTYIQTG